MRPPVLYDEPITPPYACTKCGAHGNVREWFVDIGAEVEWEGIVYICNMCMIDVVQVTPDFMTVNSHREIVAQYTKELDRLAELDQRLSRMSSAWMDLTGNSLDIFFDNLQKAVAYNGIGLGFSEFVPESIGTDSTTDRDSIESEPDNSGSDTSESDIISVVFPA